MTKISNDKYYRDVAEYYDTDAKLGFEKRATINTSLERIRNDFRQLTSKYPFSKVLEIGCGPGFDIEWFAQKYPSKRFTAVDISMEMVNHTKKRIEEGEFTNAKVLQSSERELIDKFGTASFDMIYVYFGALNTVEDLSETADIINQLLTDKGIAVLSFVNKWYMRELIVQMMKLKFDSAFARLGKTWGGYSVDRHLSSHCYSPSFIKNAFHKFSLLENKGYSIFYPPWYNDHKVKNNPQKATKLWNIDQKIQTSPLWALGEYTLFVFQK